MTGLRLTPEQHKDNAYAIILFQGKVKTLREIINEMKEGGDKN